MQTTRQSDEEQRAVFNRELAKRLASLDRGEHIDSKLVRKQLLQKSRERNTQVRNRYKHSDIPQKTGPGIYWIYLKNSCSLQNLDVQSNRLLYVGMTETIGDRNHFQIVDSSKSTLRRTLGAILKEPLKLEVRPRGFGKSPKDFANFRFSPESETKLTRWMEDHLEYEFEILTRGIDVRETTEIRRLSPPLNLNKNRTNPERSRLMQLRRLCREEAKQQSLPRTVK